MKSNYRWIFFIVGLIIFILWVSNKHHSSSVINNETTLPFSRNENHLILTKHARCRMQCRDITENEIKEILHYGAVNQAKTNLNDKRGPSYALEGVTNEHQHLRIIFAPEDDGLVVVTAIDLDKEWACNCD